MKPLKVIMLGPSLDEKGGIGSVENLIFNKAPTEVQIQHISTHDEGSIIHRLLVFGWALRQFLWKLLSGEADLVHIHLADKGSALRKAILVLMALVFRKPVIVHAHGSEFHLFYAELPQWIKQLLSWTFRQCTRFIVLSESWKDFYMSSCRLTAEQVVVLHNSVEIPPNVPARIGSNKIDFVFLGRIGQRKGVFDLLRAFASLSPKHRERAALTLAGHGEVEQARSLAESLNLIAHVTIPGWLDSSQRNELLSKADVFVLPSYNEGLPMALLEAMSWGLPVITTPVGGVPELVSQTETGLLVNPGNIQQLVEAMQSLIENESMRLSMGSAARKRITPLNIKNYCRSLLCIYHSALESSKNSEINKMARHGFQGSRDICTEQGKRIS